MRRWEGSGRTPATLIHPPACWPEQAWPGNVTHCVYHTEKRLKLYVLGPYTRRQMFFLLHRAELICVLKGSSPEVEMPHSSFCTTQLFYFTFTAGSFLLHHREPLLCALPLSLNVLSLICLLWPYLLPLLLVSLSEVLLSISLCLINISALSGLTDTTLHSVLLASAWLSDPAQCSCASVSSSLVGFPLDIEGLILFTTENIFPSSSFCGWNNSKNFRVILLSPFLICLSVWKFKSTVLTSLFRYWMLVL